jgi:hypothetical protein
MPRFRSLLLVLAGVILPVALAFSGYLIVSSLGAAADSVPLPVASPTKSGKATSGKLETPRTPASSRSSNSGPGGGDRCSEPEHRSDPACSSQSGSEGPGGGSSGSGSPTPAPTPSGDDHSGKGSGGGGFDDSGKGSSGGGSDDSGKGSSGGGSDDSGGGSGGGGSDDARPHH